MHEGCCSATAGHTGHTQHIPVHTTRQPLPMRHQPVALVRAAGPPPQTFAAQYVTLDPRKWHHIYDAIYITHTHISLDPTNPTCIFFLPGWHDARRAHHKPHAGDRTIPPVTLPLSHFPCHTVFSARQLQLPIPATKGRTPHSVTLPHTYVLTCVMQAHFHEPHVAAARPICDTVFVTLPTMTQDWPPGVCWLPLRV